MVVLGGALLGWIAGDMTVTDVAVKEWVQANVPAPGMGWASRSPAPPVVAAGRWLASQTVARRPVLVELGGEVSVPAAAMGHAPARSSLFNRILLLVDGLDSAAHAVEYVIALGGVVSIPAAETMDIRLMNG